MKFKILREELLKPLQQMIWILSGRPVLTILQNLLIEVNKETILLKLSNLEIEIIATIPLTAEKIGSITTPAKKFFNVLKGSPNNTIIEISLQKNRLLMHFKHSQFFLSTLPASSFPKMKNWKNEIKLILPQTTLKYLIETTKFSMGIQDVRYYLNGMLFKIKKNKFNTIATNGHRLAICSQKINQNLKEFSAIIPYKGIIGLNKLLNYNESLIKIELSKNNIKVHINNFTFTSKLIDGEFPNYQHIFPQNPKKILISNREELKQALLRASILSNDEFQSVHLILKNDKLIIKSNNFENEESEETITVQYNNETIEINLNVNYILEILETIKCKLIKISIINSYSSIKIRGLNNNEVNYIVMPLQL